MFYKTSGAIVVMGYTARDVKDIIPHIHEGLRTIHVFIFPDREADIKELIKSGQICQRERIKFIVHCSSKKILAETRKALKGIPKDRYFHLSLFHNRFIINISPEKRIVIDPRGQIFEQTNPDGSDGRWTSDKDVIVSWRKS